MKKLVRLGLFSLAVALVTLSLPIDTAVAGRCSDIYPFNSYSQTDCENKCAKYGCNGIWYPSTNCCYCSDMW